MELCHPVEAETTAADPCPIGHDTASPCSLCHRDTAALAKTHEIPSRNPTATKLRDTLPDDSMCADCHASADLADATTEGPLLADTQNRLVNPHDLPDTEAHEGIGCSNCHKPHADALAIDAATALCTSCHHSNVFECGTCH